MKYLLWHSISFQAEMQRWRIRYITFRATLLSVFKNSVLQQRVDLIKAVPVTLNSFPLQINLSFSYDVETSW